MDPIPYNKPFLCGNEIKYIREAVKSGKISGNGAFTKKCQRFFEDKYDFWNEHIKFVYKESIELAKKLVFSSSDNVL